MRVLLAAYAEKTHFLAMVPLAWALRSAGHEVRVATQPELVPVVVGAGLTAVPVGADHNMARVTKRFTGRWFAERHPELYEKVRWGRLPPFDLPDRPDWDYLVDGYEQVVPGYRMANEPMVDDLVGFARAWRPDLVLWEPATYAAPIAAVAAGAAHGRVLWSPDFYGRMRQDLRGLRAGGREGGDALTSWLERTANRFGVEFTEDLVTGGFTVDQFPASLRTPTGLPVVPVRYVPYPGPAVVPEWLREPPARPRVCLTLGLSSTERFGGYSVGVQEILESVADLDIEVVATVAEAERHRLGVIPGNTRVVSFVPLPVLLPTCSAVVHHAGFGTLCTSLLSGVPQLTMPEQEDAVVSSRRVAGQGAALTVHASEVTGEGVRNRVIRLLGEPSFATAADRLRDEMLEMPTPNDVVPRLVDRVAALR
ncbi:activator-dependent family glycosyltransferase [Actinosynnema sp. NPDC023587]|uniref:activator-dependent family glycosyltransferase n=1 Tax=Actinosynnema sp. NPDC023587 TaxID=3154695 RepID=UPI0034048D2B